MTVQITPSHRVCWLAIVGRGETGGERPQKSESKFDPLQTTGGVRRKPEYADHSRSFVSEAEAEAGAVALRCQPRLTKPGCERYSDLSPTSDSCVTRAKAVTIEGRDDAEEVTKPLRYGWME
jgi:hypothetical protein